MGDVGKEFVEKLQNNTRLFRERMVAAGFTIKVCGYTGLHRYVIVYIWPAAGR